MRVQASTRDKVQLALNHQELESIFKEADNVREAVLRGGRATGRRGVWGAEHKGEQRAGGGERGEDGRSPE